MPEAAVSLLLMMGGSGTRFGADRPKQFIEVAGKPVFSYILEKYAAQTVTNRACIVCHGDWIDYTRAWVDKLRLSFACTVVGGGVCRSESVRNGLAELMKASSEDEVVLIHDATHVYVDETIIPDIIEATLKYGGATVGELQYDTVYQINADDRMLESVLPRTQVVSGASPEAFKLIPLWDIYANTSLADLESYSSAGALALANAIPMKVIPTDLLNLKITYRNDMTLFEKLFHGYYF